MRSLRTDIEVANEQLAALAEAAEEARLRALVSETPVADREHHEAQRHADAMGRHRADLLSELDRLERQQDELLDRLTAGPAGADGAPVPTDPR